MSKKIEIKVQGATALPYTELVPFQGELKSLHKEDYEKLKKQILELGFSDAIAVWKNDGQNFILNGHQRLRTVQTMVEKEGYDCPPLPIIQVEADDYLQAKKKVLALTSQYGKVEKQGLYEFIHDAGIEPEDLVANFRLPEIDMGKFMDEFINDSEDLLDVGSIEANSVEATEGGRVHSAGVKMVQLFFDAEDHKEFDRMIERLKETYSTDNVTDTVLKAVKDAYDQTR